MDLDNKKPIEDDFISGDLLLEDLDDLEDFSIEESNSEGESESEGGKSDDKQGTLSSKEDEEDFIDDEVDTNAGQGDYPPGGHNGNADGSDIDNEFYHRAQYWKEIGRLPENAEVSDDITVEELEALYLKHREEDVFKTVRGKIAERLEAKGVDAEEVFESEEDLPLKFIKYYEDYGNMTYDEMLEKSDDIQATIRGMGVDYYMSKGSLSDEEVKQAVKADMNNYLEEELHTKYSTHFRGEAASLRQQYDSAKAERERKEAEKDKANYDTVKKLMESGKVLNRQYSSEEITKIQNALYKRDQWYDDGIKKRRVTLFEKKRLEQRNNPEKLLENAIKIILDVDESTVAEKHRRSGALEMLGKVAKAGSGGRRSTRGNENNNSVDTDLDEFLLDD